MTISTSTHNVLVTGAAGAIGRAVSAHLLNCGHAVRGFDRAPMPDLPDAIVAPLNDRERLDRAMVGVDTVIHLAAYRNNADFIDVLLEPNVQGLFHVCDGARQSSSVRRLVLASTLQVVGGYDNSAQPIGVDLPVRPTNHYALTKAWAEIMGDMYAHCHDLSVINVRLGWFPRDAATARRLQQSEHGVNVFLSHRDAVRFFQCCVESPRPEAGRAATVFATSIPLNTPRLDLTPAQQLLGYTPRDTWPQGIPFELSP